MVAYIIENIRKLGTHSSNSLNGKFFQHTMMKANSELFSIIIPGHRVSISKYTASTSEIFSLSHAKAGHKRELNFRTYFIYLLQSNLMSENECIILLYYIINMSFGHIWSQMAGKYMAKFAKVFSLVVSIHHIGNLCKFCFNIFLFWKSYWYRSEIQVIISIRWQNLNKYSYADALSSLFRLPELPLHVAPNKSP